MPNRELVYAILCKSGDSADLKQSFNLVTSNLQAIDSYIQSSLNTVQQGSSNITPQLSYNQYETTTAPVNMPNFPPMQRSVSAPLKGNPNDLRRSQLRFVNQQG